MPATSGIVVSCELDYELLVDSFQRTDSQLGVRILSVSVLGYLLAAALLYY
jgi:hypothetical protein